MQEIPEEVKLVIKGLDSEVRLAIIVALLKNGKRTFSQLKELLGLNSSSLSNHLSILQDGGLVNNILEWNENSYSYYTTTDIAKAVLDSLFNIIVQFPKIISPEPMNGNPAPQAPLEAREQTTISGSRSMSLALALEPGTCICK